MLKFFKSSPKPAEAAAKPVRPAQGYAARPAARSKPATGLPAEPPPLPEVSEGNQDSDWALWEDSVAFQDSQMPSVFNELDAVKTRDDPPKKNDAGPDAFSTVRKRGT